VGKADSDVVNLARQAGWGLGLLCPADLQMIADAGLVVEGHREQTLLAPARSRRAAPVLVETWAGRVGQAAAGWQVLVAVSRPKTASRLVAEYAGVQVVSTMVGCVPCSPATFARTLVSSGGTTVLPVTV